MNSPRKTLLYSWLLLASAAITAVGTTLRNELFAAEACRTVAALAALATVTVGAGVAALTAITTIGTWGARVGAVTTVADQQPGIAAVA